MILTRFISECLSLWLVFVAVPALPWQGAQPTDYTSPTADWSPRPTGLSIGELSILELFRRQDDLFSDHQACGWITQTTTNLIVTCDPSSSCAYNTDISRVGCCDQANKCTFYTSCIDASSTRTADIPGVYTCRGTSACYENTYPNGYKQYGCGNVAWATQVETDLPDGEVVQIITTGNAAPTTPLPPVTVTQTKEQPTTVIQTPTSLAPTPSSSSSQKASASTTLASSISQPNSSPTQLSTLSSSTSSPTQSTGKGDPVSQTSSPTSTTTVVPSSGLSTGAKAGIGVGAAVVGLIAATVLLICCRRRRHHPDAAELQGSSTTPWPLNTAENAHAEEAKSYGPPFGEPVHEKYGKPVEGPAEVYGSPVPSSTQFDPESVRSSTVRGSNISGSPAVGNSASLREIDESPHQGHIDVNTHRYQD